MKVFLSLHQKLDTLQEAYHAPGPTKRTANRHNVYPAQILQRKAVLSGMEGSGEVQQLTFMIRQKISTMGRPALMLHITGTFCFMLIC